jgi:hypothetical protein
MKPQVFPRILVEAERAERALADPSPGALGNPPVRPMHVVRGRLRTHRPALRRLSVPTLALLLSLGLVLIGNDLMLGKDNTERDAHIVLIRGLASEVAVAKVPLPRGKHGVFIDSKGNFDQTKATAELRLNGVAISPGMPVEITKVAFKGKEMIFELNHGGKSGKKWYQRIEIGMGPGTRPVRTDNPVLAYGSSISLKLPDDVEGVTVPQVKQLLASALDFERHSPTVLYSPSVPPKFKDAIKNHQVLVGMDRDSVLSAKGPPDRKVREVRETSEQEDWIYGLPPHVLFVSFDGDTVAKVQQY